MKLLIVLTLFGLCSAELNSYEEFKIFSEKTGKSVADYALELGFKTFELEFNKFKIDHDRKYGSPAEEEQRKFNFLKTLQFIESHNELYKKGEATHEVGVTQFADMTHDEYLQTFTMPSPLHMNITPSEDTVGDIQVYANLPASFDWRATNKVSPVKNQGQCGSCWAFTTNAMLESGYLIHHNQVVSLSEQQLVDCTHTNCGGLYINQALDYVRAHGVGSGAEYPYQAKASVCRDNPSTFHARISGYKTLGRAAGRAGPASDLEIMTAIISNGPVGLMFDAYGPDFAHYRGGILSTGGTGLYQWKASHAVTLVGWGPEYWIIKNSWGTQWGEAGFFKLARGKDLRGVSEYLYYPTF